MKKNGFTLVELLAIITILTVIMILVLPNFSSSVNDRKEKEYNKLINTIENAAKVYHSYNQDRTKVSINELVNQEFLTSEIKNPINDELISGCVFFSKDENGMNTYTYKDSCSNQQEVILKINLDGGSVSNDLSGGYLPYTVVTLDNPTKDNYSFLGWEVVEGDSVLNGNSLTIGKNLTTIKAKYNSGNSVVTFDAVEGNVSVVSKALEVNKTYGELPTPIKSRANFLGWYTQKDGGTKVTADTIVTTVGEQTLYAHWEDTIITFARLAANYSCNGVSVGDPLFIYTGACEVIDDSETEKGNWRVKFTTSGKLTLKVGFNIDLFLVGGGSTNYSGIASTYKNLDLQNSEYSVVVGAANEKTYFGYAERYYSPAGGTIVDSVTLTGSGKGTDAHENFQCGGYDEYYNCTWGTWSMSNGGKGASYGNNGQLSLSSVEYPNWGGQTTCEFNEGTKDGCTRGDLYAYSPGKGGAAKSAVNSLSNGSAGALGNGLSGNNSGAPSKSGIVVIRNAR